MATAPARLARRSIALALVGAGLALMLGQAAVRRWEAELGALAAGVLTGTETTTVPATQAFYWSSGTPDMFGLRVTPECTVAFIVGPLVIVVGLLVMGGRLPLWRVVAGGGLALAVVGIGTAVRLGLITWTTHNFGIDDGYRWSHTFGGSLVSVVEIAVALVVLLRIATRDGRVAAST